MERLKRVIDLFHHIGKRGVRSLTQCLQLTAQLANSLGQKFCVVHNLLTYRKGIGRCRKRLYGLREGVQYPVKGIGITGCTEELINALVKVVAYIQFVEAGGFGAKLGLQELVYGPRNTEIPDAGADVAQQQVGLILGLARIARCARIGDVARDNIEPGLGDVKPSIG